MEPEVCRWCGQPIHQTPPTKRRALRRMRLAEMVYFYVSMINIPHVF